MAGADLPVLKQQSPGGDPVPPILTITLNPALDLTTSIERLRPRMKLHCSKPRTDPGGGGVNVSRAIHALGGQSRAYVGLGGSNGQQLLQLLERAGIETVVWQLQGETRISLTVMEESSGLQYRFLLPGPAQDSSAAAALLDNLRLHMGSGPRFVVVSGSLLPGLPSDFFAKLASLARELGVLLILDTSGPALKAALSERSFLIKIDHWEAQELVGGGVDPKLAALRLAHELIDQKSAEAAIITIGEEGAIVATATERFQIRPPKVNVVSAVGAGDSFTAALTIGLAAGWPLAVAARFGVAAAASSVTTVATQLCDGAQTRKFFDEIERNVERLP